MLITRSWFLLAIMISLFMAPVIEEREPNLGLVLKFVAGLVIAILYAATILLHEAAHAVAARRYNHPVDSMTLHFLGGHTGVEGTPRNAREEFVMAVVGPLVSLVIAGAAWLLVLVAPDGMLLLTAETIFVLNLMLGVFNLIPGLPLDGGRMLKAVVWGLTRNEHRGTLVAGWAGRATAVLVLLLPVVLQVALGSRPTVVSWLLSFLLAAFIWFGATAAMQGARLRRRLPSLVARQLARRTLTVPEDLPVAEAVRRAQEAGAGSIVTVNVEGRPLGIVSEASVHATPEDRRPWVSTATVARSLVPGMTLPAAIAGEELIRAITFLPAHEYLLVEEDGSIFGVLSTADVDRAFRDRHR